MHCTKVYPYTYLTYHTISTATVMLPIEVCSPTYQRDTCAWPVVHTITKFQFISLWNSSYADRPRLKRAWTQTFSFAVKVADCIDVWKRELFNEILISSPATRRSTRFCLLPFISFPLTSDFTMAVHSPLHHLTKEQYILHKYQTDWLSLKNYQLMVTMTCCETIFLWSIVLLKLLQSILLLLL